MTSRGRARRTEVGQSGGALGGSGAYPLALVPSRVGPGPAVADHGPLFRLGG
jgi:hypothetical protein